MLRQDQRRHRCRGDPPLLPPAGGRLHLLPHKAGATTTTTGREVSSRPRKTETEIATATGTGTGGDLIREGNAAAVAAGPELRPRTVEQFQTPLLSANANATRRLGDHHHHHRRRGAGNRPFREGMGGAVRSQVASRCSATRPNPLRPQPRRRPPPRGLFRSRTCPPSLAA
jgi:hypothetical protein